MVARRGRRCSDTVATATSGTTCITTTPTITMGITTTATTTIVVAIKVAVMRMEGTEGRRRIGFRHQQEPPTSVHQHHPRCHHTWRQALQQRCQAVVRQAGSEGSSFAHGDGVWTTRQQCVECSGSRDAVAAHCDCGEVGQVCGYLYRQP